MFVVVVEHYTYRHLPGLVAIVDCAPCMVIYSLLRGLANCYTGELHQPDSRYFGGGSVPPASFGLINSFLDVGTTQNRTAELRLGLSFESCDG